MPQEELQRRLSLPCNLMANFEYLRLNYCLLEMGSYKTHWWAEVKRDGRKIPIWKDGRVSYQSPDEIDIDRDRGAP